MTVMSCLLWISPASDVIVAVAAIVTACMAIRGLQVWKRQVRGQSEYECARRLLASIRQVQYSFESARSPLGFTSEGEGFSGMFDDRIRIMDAAFREMRTHGINAEVLWGSEKIRGLLDPIAKCCMKWKMNVGRYCQLDAQYSKPHLRRVMPPEVVQEYDRLEKVVYGDRPDDVFHGELLDAVSEAEAFLRPRIEVK